MLLPWDPRIASPAYDAGDPLKTLFLNYDSHPERLLEPPEPAEDQVHYRAISLGV